MQFLFNFKIEGMVPENWFRDFLYIQTIPYWAIWIDLHVHVTHHIEWLWQKSKADIICLKNLLASLGVSRPFFTK